MSTGLVILHSNRLERLRDAAIGWIRMDPLPALEQEILLVQSNGMGQWLKLAMASPDGLGICAATQFVMPSRFLWSSYRAVLGQQAVPEYSPLDKSRLLWRIYRLLGEPFIAGPGFAPLAAGLGDDSSPGRRHALAGMLADIYDQYIIYRPDWLEAWERGEDALPRLTGPAADELPDAQVWQALMWRRIVADIPPGAREAGRDRAHRRWIQALAAAPVGSLSLPRRLHVFGVSSLPLHMLEAMVALSAHCQVLLHVLNPCRHFWADIVDGRELLNLTRHRHPRKPGAPSPADPVQLAAHSNPLLAAWGKQGRDFIGLLYGHDPLDAGNAYVDQFVDPVEDSESMLAWLQHSILEMDPPPPVRKPVAADDDSIRFHVCHSPQREVEVLHDRLLELFNAVPAGGELLQPRDVVVMVPDIARYAPAIDAVFGSHPFDDKRHVPYTIADRTRRSSQPLARALESLLSLPEQRLTSSAVVALLEVPAIRRRFRIDDADALTLERWMQASGIRWGLDASHRMSQRLPDGLRHNTWWSGLRRLLAGYVLDRSGDWHGLTPITQVSGLEAALLGQLIALVDALEHVSGTLSAEHTPEAWGETLRDMLARLFDASDERDEQLLQDFLAGVGLWSEACCEAGLQDSKLPLDVVRSAVLDALDAEGLSQRFLAGRVNFCTLMPMRAIPFRVVCLLGMDDTAYPRRQASNEVDLMASRYRPGDRSRREDDRYLFLEAILSARERLYISHVGRSIRDESVRPPSVLVAQLRDWLDAEFVLPSESGSCAVSEALTVVHPLQPFGRGCFTPGSPSRSHAIEWCEALSGHSRLDSPLPPFKPSTDTLSLAELRRFLRQPVDYFFSTRLRVRAAHGASTDPDNEPFVLDGLQRHAMGREWVESLLRDTRDAEAQLQRWQLSDRVPAGEWAVFSSSDLLAQGERVGHALADLYDVYPDTVDPLEVVIALEGSVVSDWIGGLRQGSSGMACIHWHGGNIRGRRSRGLSYHHLLLFWLSHLALAAAGHRVTACFVAADETLVLPEIAPEWACERLQDICNARREGLDEPLPVSFKAAMIYLSAVDRGEDKALTAAAKRYEGDDFTSGETSESPALVRTWPTFSDMQTFSSWANRLYAHFHSSVSGKRNDQQTS